MAEPQTSRPATWQDLISAEATKQQIDPRLALAVAETESNFNPDATSPKGAHGIMQLMPATAAKWKVDAADPVGNIRGGVSELKALLDEHKGDVVMALRRYNGSPQADPTLTQPYVDKVLQRIKPSTSPGQLPPPVASAPPVGEAPPAPESWTDWGVRQGKAALSSLDPRTSEGRRNIGGGIGAMVGGALAAPTGLVSGPVGPGTGALLGAGAGGAIVSGAESLYHHIAGTPEEGSEVGSAPPTLVGVARSAAGGGVEQGAYELGGRVLMWPIKAAGRQVIASRVGKFAAGKISAGKTATLGALQSALDSSQTLFRTTKAGAKEAGARAAVSTRGAVSQAAGGARQAVAGAVEKGAEQKAGASGMAAAGVTAASEKAASGEAAARAPYETLVGAPPPSAASAGKQVNEVAYHGGAAKARDFAGEAVERAAESGPDVDITGLKAEAQRILETEIKPPAEAFPRTSAEQVTGDQVAQASGFSPEEFAKLQSAAAEGGADSVKAQQLKIMQDAVASAGGAETQEVLKHPAMQTLNRILNAEDTVKFSDAHKFKRELDEAVGGAWDKSVKSRVVNVTKHMRGMLRDALAGHAPYDQATAAYQQIAPLYTQGIAPKVRRLAIEEPEAIIRLLNPGQPTKAAMLVDLLTHQATEGGDAAGGRRALEAVQSAWVRQKLINGGIEKLGDRLAKLSPEFKHAFLSDPKAQAVLDHLKLIHTAYQTAVLTGEKGIEAAKLAGRGGVEAAGELAAQRTGAVREAGRQTMEGVREVGAGIRAQTAQAGRTAVESAREAVPPAKGALKEGQAAFRGQEDALADSSIGATLHRGSIERRGADVLRAMLQGPSSTWGGISIVRLLHGPTAQDLVHWAAASPAGTRAFVKAITSNVPAMAIADLARTSGILDSTADVVAGKPPKGPPAPDAPTEEGLAAGGPPPR